MLSRRDLLKLAALVPGLRLSAQQPPSGVMQPVLTRSGGNLRHGAYLSETTLTPANVQARGLRPYFTLPMEGDARGSEAQPLIVPGVQCSDGVVHDVLIACSMNNLVYAFDANDSAILWAKKLGYPVNGSAAIDMWAINDHWGILSTPVIDAATFRLYVVAWLSPDGTPQKAEHSIFELDIRSGEILYRLSLAGLTYTPGHALPIATWQSMTMRKQRSSLLLTDVAGVKTVFFASGSFLETGAGASGWINAYDCASHRITATLSLAPHYGGSGMWMAGQGLASDAQGYLYGVTGNGGFDGLTDFGECVVKIEYTPGVNAKLAVIDWWSPYSDAGRVGHNPTLPSASMTAPKMAGLSAPSEEAQHAPVNAMAGMAGMSRMNPLITGSLAYGDQDLGSAGVTLIEEYGLALFSGKDGIYYVCRKDALGKTQLADFAQPAANYAKAASIGWFTFYPGDGVSPAPAASSDLDFLFAGRTHHMHSTPVIAQLGGEYRCWCWGENGNLRCWRVNQDGTLSYLGCSAEVASPNASVPSGGMPGGMLCLSAHGSDPNTAILWAAVPLGDANKSVTTGHLYAYDAWNIGAYSDGAGALKLLWQSPEISYNKFMPPVVSGGRVFYAGYRGEVLCFGLS